MTERRRTGIVRRIVAVALVVTLIGWVIRGIANEASQQSWEALAPDYPTLGVAVLVLYVAYVVRSYAWTIMMRSAGQRVGAVDGVRVFMGATLGRYLPGKLWHVAGAGWLAARIGVSAQAAVYVTLAVLLVHYLIGGGFALLAVDAWTSQRSWAVGLSLAAAAAALVLVMSPAFPRLVAYVQKRRGRDDSQGVTGPTTAGLMATVPIFAAAWLMFGVVLRLTVSGLFPAQPPPDLLTCTGVIAAAAVIGFAVLLAPSGLGVREAVIVALLGPVVGVGRAGVTALGLRVLMTVVEMSLALWGLAPHLRASREVPQDPDSQPPAT